MKKIISRLFIMALAMVTSISFLPCGLNASANDDIINVTISGTYNYDYAFEMLDILNKIRENAGLLPFHMDKNDLEDCMQRAAELSVYYSHTRPDGKEGLGMETCACHQNTPQEAVTAWMNSPQHHDILMTPSFGTGMYDKDEFYAIGAGCFMDAEGQYYWIFGSTARLETTFASELEYNGTKNITKTIPCIKSIISETGWSMLVDEQFTDREYTYGETKQVPYRMTTEPYNNASPLDYSNFTFVSSNPSVAKVNDNEHYISLVNAGSATIRATLRDDESIYFERNITVKPKNLSNLKIKYQTDDTIFYDGTPKTPKITIDNLVENRDYVVKYEDNIGNPSVASSLAKVIVTGINNYTGIKTDEFQIVSNSKCVKYGDYWEPPHYDEEFGDYIGGGNCIGWYFDHKYSSSWTIDKVAACSSEGSKSHHCTVCGDKKDITTVPKTSHKYISKVTKSATCIESGVRTYTCSGCNDSYTESIPAIGHKYSSSWTIDIPATCKQEGSKSHHCTVCGDKKDITSIPKTSHKYISKVTKSATCMESGVRTYTCSGCNDSYTESIPATGHKYSSSWTIDIPATCKQEGSKSHHCTVCGDKKDITVISKTSHNYDEGKVTVQPTCTKTGVKTYTCKYCGNTKTETIVKISHNYISDVTKEPTCTEDGEKKVFCTMCNESHLESISKKGHNYTTTIVNPSYTSNGYTIHICSECGYTFNDNYKNKLMLSNVSGLKVTKTAHNAIKLGWNLVPDADGYIVYRYDNQAKNYIKISKDKNPGTFLYTHLNSGEMYKFAVTAYKTVDGKDVESQSFSVVTGYTNLPTISGFKVTKTAHNAIKLGWNKILGADGYYIYRYDFAKKQWRLINNNVRSNTFLFTHLNPGTKYQFAVRAYKTVNGKNIVSESFPVSVGYTNLHTVSGFKVTKTAHNAIKLGWNKISGADGYYIYRYDFAKKQWRLINNNVKSNAFLFTHLNPGTKYQFAVRACKIVNGKTVISESFPVTVGYTYRKT